MTLDEALRITLIRKDELSRVNVNVLRRIINQERDSAERFPFDSEIKKRIAAYERILEEVSK